MGLPSWSLSSYAAKDDLYLLKLTKRWTTNVTEKHIDRHFPGGPVVKTLPSNAGGAGSIPGRGAEIPHASWPKNQNVKQKQYCNKFNKDFKNGPHQKKKNLKENKSH